MPYGPIDVEQVKRLRAAGHSYREIRDHIERTTGRRFRVESLSRTIYIDKKKRLETQPA